MFDDDVPQVFVSLADVHALDGLGGLTGVLVGQNKQTLATAAKKKMVLIQDIEYTHQLAHTHSSS